MTDSTNLPEHLTITHEAMMTTFSLRLCGEDEGRLRGLGSECIAMIDDLEQKLSRFAEGGEVYRINRLKAGESLNLSEECDRCLRRAMEMSAITGGLFDPTLGVAIAHRKSGDVGELPSVEGKLALHPDKAVIHCEEPGRVIDLGGIGKGFALDCLAAFLQAFDVQGGLLSSGASTHLAFGEYSWPISLAGVEGTETYLLADAAISASGTGIQGAHIVAPQGWDVDEAMMLERLWALAPNGSAADAWSTALMLLRPEEMDAAVSKENHLLRIWKG